jgi:hypothetical protein
MSEYRLPCRSASAVGRVRPGRTVRSKLKIRPKAVDVARAVFGLYSCYTLDLQYRDTSYYLELTYTYLYFFLAFRVLGFSPLFSFVWFRARTAGADRTRAARRWRRHGRRGLQVRSVASPKKVGDTALLHTRTDCDSAAHPPVVPLPTPEVRGRDTRGVASGAQYTFLYINN